MTGITHNLKRFGVKYKVVNHKAIVTKGMIKELIKNIKKEPYHYNRANLIKELEGSIND